MPCIFEHAAACPVLQELEEKILRLLKEAKGNILDDELLINTLNNSKQTSSMIQARVAEAEETERSINEVRRRAGPWLAVMACAERPGLLCPYPILEASIGAGPIAASSCVRRCQRGWHCSKPCSARQCRPCCPAQAMTGSCNHHTIPSAVQLRPGAPLDRLLVRQGPPAPLTTRGMLRSHWVPPLSCLQARERYRPAAARGSILYFAIADLALISPMYQNSLAFFVRTFNACIEASERSPDVPTRLKLLCDHATRFIFTQLQRGLFERHKLLFAFMVAAATARAAGEVSQVRGGMQTALGHLGGSPPPSSKAQRQGTAPCAVRASRRKR